VYRGSHTLVFLFDRGSTGLQSINPPDIALWKKNELAYVNYFHIDKVDFDALMCGAKRDTFQSGSSSSAHCTLGEAVFGLTNLTHQRVIVRNYRAETAKFEGCRLLPVLKRPKVAAGGSSE
jgi:hypothetical protein